MAAVLPLFHVGGLNIQTIPCLYAGGTVVLAETFTPEGLLDMLRRHRPTHLLLVPAAMEALLAAPSLLPEDLDSLGALNCGSSPVPESSIRRFNALGVRVVQVYGATETGPTAVVLDYAEGASRRFVRQAGCALRTAHRRSARRGRGAAGDWRVVAARPQPVHVLLESTGGDRARLLWRLVRDRRPGPYRRGTVSSTSPAAGAS